jgi:hypothetical protein
MESKYQKTLTQVNRYWTETLNVNQDFLTNIHKVSKTKFIDAYSRNVHYQIVMKAVGTRAVKHHFMNVPDSCKLCYINLGSEFLEDIPHVFVHCPRAEDFWNSISNFLEILMGKQLTHNHKIFGIIDDDIDVHVKTACNTAIIIAQRAIWSTRVIYETSGRDLTIPPFFKLKLRTVLLRAFNILGEQSYNRTYGFLSHVSNRRVFLFI